MTDLHRIYIGAGVATRGTHSEVNAYYFEAHSKAEAEGLVYARLREKWPTSLGWTHVAGMAPLPDDAAIRAAELAKSST